MTTWKEFATTAPDLATFGAGRLAGKVAYMATLQSDGSPRLHPVTPHIGEDQLFVYLEPTSPKAEDLQRDGRYAMHCSVEDTHGGQGEFTVRGRAELVEDAGIRTALFQAARRHGFHPQDRYVLFQLSVETAISTVYEKGQPVRKRWDAGDNHRG